MFQGGGGCWNAQVYKRGGCTASLEKAWRAIGMRADGSGGGFFDRSNDLNPFRSYTIVLAPYCSGDAFMGNTQRPSWEKHNGSTVAQLGYENTLAVVSWTLDNVGPTLLNNLVLGGWSAGAMGVQAWADHLLGAFKYKAAAVIADSYAGIFPPGTQGPYIFDFGACSNSIWPPDLLDLCSKKEATLQMVFSRAIKRFPNVKFGIIQSKADSMQRTFYRGIALTHGMFRKSRLSGPQLFYETNAVFEGYNLMPNFVVYYVEGTQHCFTQCNSFYRTNTTGPTSDKPTLHRWVRSFVTSGVSPSTECSGVLLPNRVSNGVHYCDVLLSAKRSLVSAAGSNIPA